jgi:mannose-1-phosphate guanylyltransferase
MKKSDRYIIIMAGGKGERFWPVSREKTPKQLISLLGRQSFLQQTVARVRRLAPAENIIVITNKVQAAAVRKQLPFLPKANVVAEPCGRDTCAAVALGAAIVGAKSKNGVMAVLPADHVIPEPKEFNQVLSDCFEVASQENSMVTIGIAPTEPATGYGYIHAGKAKKTPTLGSRFFQAKRFVEKPSLAKAEKYLSSGQYRWNAGMFIWSYATIIDGLKRHVPSLAKKIAPWERACKERKLDAVLARQYPKLEKISVDFALMEKADNVLVADGTFAWDDLGAWTALARHIAPDAQGNCVQGDLAQVDSSGNVVFDVRTGKRGTIALVGVQDSIIVLTDDATMIATKAAAQKIKQLVQKLAQQKRHARLV